MVSPSVGLVAPFRKPAVSSFTRQAEQKRAVPEIGADALGVAQQISVVTQPGLVPFSFIYDNVTAGLSSAQMSRFVGSVPAVVPVLVPYRGSIAALVLEANAAKSAGTCSFTVAISGVPVSDATLAWSSGDTAYQAYTGASYGFSAGSELDVRITTDSSFAPITVDIEVTLYIIANPNPI